MRPRIAFGNPGTLIVLEELDQMRYSMNGSRRPVAGLLRELRRLHGLHF